MPSARKTKLKVPVPRPRNPFAVPAAGRKAGKHGKSPSALRRQEKLALKKLVDQR